MEDRGLPEPEVRFITYLWGAGVFGDRFLPTLVLCSDQGGSVLYVSYLCITIDSS